MTLGGGLVDPCPAEDGGSSVFCCSRWRVVTTIGGWPVFGLFVLVVTLTTPQGCPHVELLFVLETCGD